MSCFPPGIGRHRTLLRGPHCGASATHPTILLSSYLVSATRLTSCNGLSLPVSSHRRTTGGISGSWRASVRANSMLRHRVSGMSRRQVSVSSRSHRRSFTTYSIPLSTRSLMPALCSTLPFSKTHFAIPSTYGITVPRLVGFPRHSRPRWPLSRCFERRPGGVHARLREVHAA